MDKIIEIPELCKDCIGCEKVCLECLDFELGTCAGCIGCVKKELKGDE